MNRTDHLLLTLEEEAIEVAKAALNLAHTISKSLRFGVVHDIPGTTRNNRMDIGTEFAQLSAMMEMLMEHGLDFPGWDDPEIRAKKKAAFLKYLEFSRARGTFEEAQIADKIVKTTEAPEGTYLFGLLFARDNIAAMPNAGSETRRTIYAEIAELARVEFELGTTGFIRKIADEATGRGYLEALVVAKEIAWTHHKRIQFAKPVDKAAEKEALAIHEMLLNHIRSFERENPKPPL